MTAGLVVGLEGGEHAPRGLLLGRAARAAFAEFLQAQCRDRALDLEGLRMGLAARGGDPVGRHRQLAALQPLLQLGLGVLAPAADLGAGDHLAEKPPHHALRGLEAAVDEGGADQCLHGVGEDRGTLRAARPRLALGQAHHIGQAQRQRSTVQAVLAHEVRAHAGEVALVGAGEALVEQSRHRQAQHGIAEELEAFVVLGTEAAMRQGVEHQGGLPEAVAQALLQAVESRIHQNPQVCAISSGPGTSAAGRPGRTAALPCRTRRR
jgi:hypothetical protein